MEESKKCNKCLETKPVILFYAGKVRCKTCINAQQKESRINISDAYCRKLLRQQGEDLSFDPETLLMIKRVEIMAYRLKSNVKQMKLDRL